MQRYRLSPGNLTACRACRQKSPAVLLRSLPKNELHPDGCCDRFVELDKDGAVEQVRPLGRDVNAVEHDYPAVGVDHVVVVRKELAFGKRLAGYSPAKKVRNRRREGVEVVVDRCVVVGKLLNQLVPVEGEPKRFRG